MNESIQPISHTFSSTSIIKPLKEQYFYSDRSSYSCLTWVICISHIVQKQLHLQRSIAHNTQYLPGGDSTAWRWFFSCCKYRNRLGVYIDNNHNKDSDAAEQQGSDHIAEMEHLNQHNSNQRLKAHMMGSRPVAVTIVRYSRYISLN